jgi:hypothetical protein
MRNIILLLTAISCTEVSISKVPEVDTSVIPATDSTEPSVEPSTEPPVEQAEGIGGYVHYYLRQVACPACMGELNEITVEFDARFHEKTFDTYTRHIPEQGQCTQSITQVWPSISLMDMGLEIKANANGQTIHAYKTQQGNYFNSWYSDEEYVRDALHSISREDNYEFANFTSFHGFDSIEPYELRYVDPSYAFAAPIYRSGATFWWSPHGTNTTFTITLAVYTQDGSSLMGYVTCSGNDSGMMTIPGQYLASYPVWSLVAVHMTRHKVELVHWEEQNTFLETHMEWDVIGTGHIE